MSSKIIAGNATNLGVVASGATDGILELQTGSTPTTAVTITAAQNVGIGTASPTSPLHVAGSSAQITVSNAGVTQYTYMLRDGYYSVGGDMALYTGGANNQTFWTNATERMRIGSDGKVAIGTTTTSNGRLTVKQATDSYSDCFNLVSGTASGSVAWQLLSDGDSQRLFFSRGGGKGYIDGTTGAYVPISDSRAKKNIVDLNYGLSEILRLRPVQYNINIEQDTAKTHIGLIAQEVKAVIDEAVDDLRNTEDMYGLDKSGLVPILIKAIQELNVKVDAQATTIAELQARLPAENT